MNNFYVKLLQIYERLNTGNSIEDSLEYIFEAFKEYIPYDRIGLALLGSDNNIYSYSVQGDYQQHLKTGYSLGLMETSLGAVIKNKEFRIIDDYIPYLEMKPNSKTTQLLVAEGIRSSICFPLLSNNVCIGVLLFASKKPNAYYKEHIELVKLIASSVAISVEKYLVVDDLILSAITGFAKLVEAKDCDTGAHIERMQNYSRIIAKGLSENPKYKDIITNKYIDDIYKFSPLHDIGKVGIADGILLKPGRLTHEEFEVMKMHTTIGANVLKEASSNALKKDRNFFDIGIEIALGHHEKYNGKGYPNGLCGEEIPLSARIVMAADVLDALTSKRVYKQAIDIDTSLKMMVDESGQMFDPDIVEVILDKKVEILEIYRKLQEQIEWSR